MTQAIETGVQTAPRARNLARGPRLRFAMAVIALMCLLMAPLFVENIDRAAPKPVGGQVDYSAHGPLTAPVLLGGQWRLVWMSGAPGPPAGTVQMVKAPGRWTDTGQGLPSQGAGSYRLTITGLQAGRYILHVPTIYTASRVSVNGRVLSERGAVGVTPATSRPTVRSHDVAIDTDGGPLELALDVSTFGQWDNGMAGPPLFGTAATMERWIALHWLRSLLLVTSLLLLACYGVIIFIFRRQERASFYFGLASLMNVPVMSIFAHDNMILLAAPGLSVTAMLTVEYLTVVIALAALVAYTALLFPKENGRWAFWSIQTLIAADFIAYCVGVLVDGNFGLAMVSFWSVWVRLAVLTYVLWQVGLATWRHRPGAAVYLLGMLVCFGSLIYQDLKSNNLLPSTGPSLDLMPLGMLVLLLCQIVIMAERWGGAVDSAESSNNELRQLLDVNIAIASEIELNALLRRIVTVTSQILRADRSSLFLHDRKTDELWSMVAEGVESREIRFPVSSGLAGNCFSTGAAINVTNAYADPRFNQAVDQATGYRTRAALSAPIITRDGRKLGVMQAFNRIDGEPFDEADVARIMAFAAQAAVAIENATLFAEVASERNYNDSILRSMSSGVVTLDREANVAKLNAAACQILGVEPEAAGAPETRDALISNNPWLPDEIAAVAATGRPKTLLDADVRTLRGDTISANISIVPLMADDAEQAGLLIIVEDISEGKRMQGAMRRFMTQNVVDQIMGREDELLFGAACQASVLFADIRNFTGMAEQLGPRDTVDMLNEIFTDLFEAVAAAEGLLDKFMGDALMAVYGAPISSDRDPLNAVDSAVAMSAMLVAINTRRAARGGIDLRLGVGIASGEVVAGTIGSPKRMDYTVIGDSVNLASRLEKITKTYGVGIVVCEDTARAVGGAHRLRELDTIRVRGRTQPSKIFQVVTAEAPLSQAALATYAEGRTAMAEGRWADAVAAFEATLLLAPGDRPAALMLERCRILVSEPPATDWDGVWDSPRAA